MTKRARLVSVGSEGANVLLWIDRGLKSGKVDTVELSPQEQAKLIERLGLVLATHLRQQNREDR